MSSIMLIMQRKSIAQGLMDRLQGNGNIKIIYEPNYNKAEISIGIYSSDVALIEVAESGVYGMEFCLTLCKRLRNLKSKCKLLLMCPEQDEESVKKVVDAKTKNEIDDFVFYDVTIDYLKSKLLSM